MGRPLADRPATRAWFEHAERRRVFDLLPEAAIDRWAGIYFVQDCGTGLVKIGVTSDIRGRLNVYETSNPAGVRLLAVVPGGAGEEREMHARFAHLRVRGEWFMPVSTLGEYLSHATHAVPKRPKGI